MTYTHIQWPADVCLVTFAFILLQNELGYKV